MSKRLRRSLKAHFDAWSRASSLNSVPESNEYINHVQAVNGIIFFIQQAEECGLQPKSRWDTAKHKLEELIKLVSDNIGAFEQGIVIHYNQTRTSLLTGLQAELERARKDKDDSQKISKIKTALGYATNTEEITVEHLHKTE
ncbi:uncharacterized protein FOMMEDRAFT_156711 [Fomitiporia mediterranea MF3/22]|uniref:uncharacterized protein n=1 Tax=Fomitiporia mediterranea (strain MF3/22) TaxID=694068 RepID=UPI0004409348|nr:uncharacterized protein FOMMEDRAFT_156711 [Fomitiporia mediterranea MF3/22]EJD03326.1 hypothetical protein FOMMEDRAFT_156711 [Fomitiporia mediterranea MF3/22]